jgi:membrane protein implicated in regulation of membrane protease activity
MQLFVIGTQNGSVEPEGHLLRASFQGPAWVTGGALGTEASFLMYPVIALMFVYVWWRFGHTRKVRARDLTGDDARIM